MLVCYGLYDAFGYSTDPVGDIWTPVPNPTGGNDGNWGIRGLAMAPYDDLAVITGAQVMVGPADPAAWADVSVWKPVAQLVGQGTVSVAYSESLGLFAIGSSLATGVPAISTSSDAVTWEAHPLSWPQYRSVDVLRWIEDLGIFIAGGAYNGSGDYVPRIVTSPDGVTWTDSVVPVEYGTITEFAWSPELQRLVAVGTNGLRFASDDGGETWTSHSEPYYLGGGCVRWVPEMSQFVHSAGYLSASPDGLAWTYTGWSFDKEFIFWQDHFITNGNTSGALARTPSNGPFPPQQIDWLPTATPAGPHGHGAWSRGVFGIEVFPDLPPLDPPTGTLEDVRRIFA